MAARYVGNVKVIKLNLLEGAKYIKKDVGIRWSTFIVSVILITIMTLSPILTLKLINGQLSKKINTLNETYRSLRKKEQTFKNAVKQKEEIVTFIDTSYSLIVNQPKLDIVLNEIRSRFPKGSVLQGGMSISVEGTVVAVSLKVVSDNYLDAPQLIDAFASSPYLYVAQAEVSPIELPTVSKTEKDKWNYNVKLLLVWKPGQKEGGNK